jgi:hypothetical protein
MMQKRPVGRPRKPDAKKPGQLKKGECRFTFITTQDTVERIKFVAKNNGVSIKDFMSLLLKKPNHI